MRTKGATERGLKCGNLSVKQCTDVAAVMDILDGDHPMLRKFPA